MSISTIRALRSDNDLKPEAQKLLSFTDNRQDASLQAGHFNDFVQVTLLRSAILSAVERAGPAGLSHDEIARAVTASLQLDIIDYATNPEALFAARKATDDALRDVIGYFVYHDLRRGWRVVAPNLEQVGCLRLGYEQLDELCAYEPVWSKLAPDLAAASPGQRFAACKAILNHMRRSLAIKVRYLDPTEQDRLKQQSYQYLRLPWAIDQDERLLQSTALVAPGVHGRGMEDVTLGARSLLGGYLRRGKTWPATRGPGQRVSEPEYDELAHDLLKALVQGGYVEAVPGYDGAFRLQAGVMRWYVGDGTVEYDPIRVMAPSDQDVKVNHFFSELYQLATEHLQRLEAREHTAQVPTIDRADRELRFGAGTLPVLYCSPTMELGVDIQDLNAVNLRNIPPTPANYAQRSGRAGRSGQAALVLAYCTSNNPHDQYYFRRPTRMVAGAVVPPRIDLANEDLLRAHVHAVWLAETGQSLYAAVSELLDLSVESYPLKASVRAYVDQPQFQLTAEQRCVRLLTWLTDDLTPVRAPWFNAEWLSRTIQGAPRALDQAADRWRNLYRTARVQQDRQHKIVADPLRSADEQRGAQRLREEAESQVELLTRSRPDVYSDFYSYRYFATEGFLPGYNFPRLPVTAYIPGRQRRRGQEEYLSRARFVAISEFGPRSILYHEGSRYRVSRVVLPPEENGSRLRSAHFCKRCGYGHFADRLSVDLCDRCGGKLDGTWGRLVDNLLRLDSVSTYRVDRISCNEEERLRLGYEVRTIYRFGTRDDGTPAIRSVIFVEGSQTRARGTYGSATTIWRINQGWNRRKDRTTLGFVLDMEKGIWSKSDLEQDDGAAEADPLTSPSTEQRVIPFVEDRRNAFVLIVSDIPNTETLLSVQYALKRGIEARYQLESSELAVEAMPSETDATQILFYEASEGGAGVLVRLAEDPGALAKVAREALSVCHFDPDTGVDLRREERAIEDCEAACYDCLLSYTNQRYHEKLDRQLVKDILLRLAATEGATAPSLITREEHRDRLLRTCGSDLERDFLRWLDDSRLRLPDAGQKTIDGTAARPDFVYDGGDALACVYVDGAPHRFAERQARDREITRALENLGWTVVRVEGADTWVGAVQAYPWIFGTLVDREVAVPS